VLDAVVVGATREADIALLKIDASGLPAIPLYPSGRAPRQGQLVLAVGSPEGLDNTMTVGIISAVGRQPSPDFPMLYIQTDAAINPGNSGGPLLNMEGELIGMNTFVINDSGRNQGLGFAVPAAVVRYAYEQLRSHGAVRYSLVGVRVQTVTPGLAQGLGLSRGYGVMIADVLPGSPAELAGLQARDIIMVVDGSTISALPYYTALTYLHDPAVPVAVTVLRAQETLQFLVPALAVDDQVYTDASIDPHESLIPELGIFGKALNPVLARRNGLRSKGGSTLLRPPRGMKTLLQGWRPAMRSFPSTASRSSAWMDERPAGGPAGGAKRPIYLYRAGTARTAARIRRQAMTRPPNGSGDEPMIAAQRTSPTDISEAVIALSCLIAGRSDLESLLSGVGESLRRIVDFDYIGMSLHDSGRNRMQSRFLGASAMPALDLSLPVAQSRLGG
jgi:hypothetical protein